MKPTFRTTIHAAAALALAAAFTARAELAGPYTADALTTYLFHFNEPAGASIATNAGVAPHNAVAFDGNPYAGDGTNQPVVTTLFGAAAFPGFGTAANISAGDFGLGIDLSGDGGYRLDDGSPLSNDRFPDHASLYGIGNQFTLEALIRLPAITGSQRKIISSDNSAGAADRGFQFRVNTGGSLEFNAVGGVGGAFAIPIPTTGPHAFVANEWFHVAAVYDGGRLSLYWTRVSPAHTAANLIGGPIPRNADFADDATIVIGNEARVVGATGSTDGLLGQIDEVRVSRVARAAGEMMFATTNVTIVRQPLSQGVDHGGAILLSAGVSSASTAGFQWRHNGVPIPGATASVLVISNATALHAGAYDCVVTNAIGSAATSAVATVTVGAANFLAHRYSFTTDASDSVGGAHGTNLAIISGGLLQLDGVSGHVQLPSGMIPANHGAVSFETWAAFGPIANNTMLFAFGDVDALGTAGTNYLFCTPHSGVNTRIAITAGPGATEQQIISPGVLANRAVHLVAVFNPLLGRLELYTNGVSAGILHTNIGATLGSVVNNFSYLGRSLFIADPYLAGNIDEFRIYRGALGPASVAKAFRLGPDAPLSDGPVAIVSSPANLTVASGQPAAFAAVFNGGDPIQYQWLKNGAPVPGATNATFAFTATFADNGAAFTCLATNIVGGVPHHATSGTATLTVLVPPTLAWLGAASGDWDTTSPNWTNESAGTVVAWSPFNGARFDARGAGQPTINLALPVNPLQITVNADTDYAFTSPHLTGALTGLGSLTKSGAGTLVIDVTNTMSGPVLISGGTLQIGNFGFSGSLGHAPVVTNNAALVVQRADEITITNAITGSGTLAQSGFAGLILTASNSHTGLTLVSAGTLHPRHPFALGTAAAGTEVGLGAQLFVDQNINIENEAFVLNGATALRKGGGGVSILGGPVTLASDAGITVDGGATLNLTSALGITSAGASLTLDGAGAAQGWVGGPINLGGGAGVLNKIGSGTWTLAGPNAMSLATISGGTLALAHNHALGTNQTVALSSTTGGVGLSGTRLTLAGGTVFTGRSLAMTSSGPGTIRTAFFSTGAGATNFWNGPVNLAGDGDLGNRIGIGVDAGNTFVINGNITADASFPGILLMRGSLGGAGFLNGSVLLNAATGQFQVDDGTTWVLGGSGHTWATTIFAGSSAIRLGAPNAMPVTTALTVGHGVNHLDLAGFNQQVANLDIPGGGLIITNSSTSADATFTCALPGVATFGGAFGDGPRALNLVVASGTLVLTNPASLNLSRSAVSIASGASLQMDYTGTNTVAGLVLGGASQAPGLYNSATSPGFLAGAGSLLVVPPIAPHPTNITASVSGGFLNLNWPGTHLGWILQTQTNTLGTGLGTNWFDLPATAAVTNTSITINPADPAVFFRLRRP